MSDLPPPLLSNSANVPPEDIAADEARLALAPLQSRRAALLDSLKSIDVRDEEELRRVTDKIALARACREGADEALEPVARPYRDSSYAVRNVALQFVDPLKAAELRAAESIKAFRRRQREAAAKAANEQAERERELREKAGLTPAVEARPVTQADVQLPSVRSDYRGQVFDRKVLLVEIVDPRALPDTILKSPGVTEALEKAVRKLAALDRNIPGAKITDDQSSSVKAG